MTAMLLAAALTLSSSTLAGETSATFDDALESAPEPRQSRFRKQWYIGFGLGASLGRVSPGPVSDAQLAPSMLLEVGWVAQPWLLLGLEGSVTSNLDIIGSSVALAHADFMATVFPVATTGAYLKGGVGYGAAEASTMCWGEGDCYHAFTGLDVAVGLGWEWQLHPSFRLGADAAWHGISSKDGRASGLSAHLTFAWP